MATRRNSLRYSGYDYRQPGWLFITIRTFRRQQLFGSVVDGQMVLSPPGITAENLIAVIPDRYVGVICEASVFMPDHIHIVLFFGSDPESECSPALGDVVRWFKTSFHAT